MIALLIDIGNTRVKWRVARLDVTDIGMHRDASPPWVAAEQAILLSDLGAIEAAFRASAHSSLALASIDLVLIANVASEAAGGAVLMAVSLVWPGSIAQFVLPVASSCGLVNAYRDPLQLGVDRWLAAVAAHGLYPDRSVLVCTFGTATTIDLVEIDRFVGGLILPGFDAMKDVLATSTARLPARDGQLVDFGDRTEDAIASGVMAAQIGAVERTLRKARKRQTRSGEAPAPVCILAGGAAERMVALFGELDTPYDLVHDLVLRGLAAVGRDTIAPQQRSIPTVP